MWKKTVSGLLLALLLLGTLMLAFSIQPVKASGTIYIRPNGRVEPKGTPLSSIDKITYTFTGNIYDQIVVERDNIVVDGAGYTLQGTGGYSSKGIDLSYRSKVTIRNMEIKAFGYGVWLDHSSYNSITGNNITGNSGYGIHLQLSSNNNISGNTVAYHPCGIALYQSSGNTISGNTASNNGRSNIWLEGSSNNNTVCGNTVENSHGEGVGIFSSSYNNITGNIISYNYPYGMSLLGSSYNSATGNIISYNDPYGICLMGSNYNNVSENTVTNGHEFGIYLDSARYNNVSENTVKSNWFGIYLYAREFAPASSNNVFYHNNFMKNRHQVHDYSWEEPDVPPAINTWDDGYPSGGNYWSDYTGVDVKSGPNQDQPSSDSIGDTPYVIDPNNQDNYPLMYPWGAPLPPAHTLTIDSSPVGVTFTIDDVSRTTPWSETYSEGTPVSLVMPETHDGYVWSYWLEDEDPSRTKIVTMDTNVTLTAVFTLDTTPPTISIVSPEDKTYPVEEVPVTFALNESTSWIGYSLDGQANITISGNTTLTGLSGGMHSLVVYASDIAGNVGSSDIVYFTIQTTPIDTTPPSISIVSPENKTYDRIDIPLTFTIDESVSWMAYSLDNTANVTITGNTTLSGLSDGSHSLIVYVRDTAGNTGASDMVYFSAEPPPPEPFPVEIVAVLGVMAVVGAVILIYFTKFRKRK